MLFPFVILICVFFPKETHASICIGPVCFSVSPVTKITPEAQPSTSSYDLIGMIYNNALSTIDSYARSTSSYTHTVVSNNYMAVANYLLIVIALVCIGNFVTEFIKGRHRTHKEEIQTEQPNATTRTDSNTSTIVNLNNTMRCEPIAPTLDDNTDKQQLHETPGKQCAIFTRTQGSKESLVKYSSDLLSLATNLFQSEEMLKFIFARGIYNEQLRERVVERYLTRQQDNMKDLITYAINMELVLEGIKTITTDNSSATETDDARNRPRFKPNTNNNNNFQQRNQNKQTWPTTTVNNKYPTYGEQQKNLNAFVGEQQNKQ